MKLKKVGVLIANTGFAMYNFRLPLIREMLKRGWHVIVIANDEDDYCTLFKNEGVEFIDIRIDHKGMNPWRDLSFLYKCSKALRRIRPSLVHNFTIKPVIYGSLAAKSAGAPAIINTITGLGYVFEKGGIIEKVSKALYRLSLSGKCKVIFQNEGNRQYFIASRLAKASNSYLVPGSGVDTEKVRPSDEGNSEKPSRIVFAMVSRMLWSKGVKEFVEAAESFRKKRDNVEFIMVGGHSGGGARGNPEAVPEEWLTSKTEEGIIKWYGRVSHGEALQHMQKATVIVLPSFYPEGVPKSLLEAAAMAKPIITSDAPGCREVVVDGKSGFLVPARNAKALEQAMAQFVDDPSIIGEMGAAGRRRATEEYDVKNIIQATIDVYREAGVEI